MHVSVCVCARAREECACVYTHVRMAYGMRRPTAGARTPQPRYVDAHAHMRATAVSTEMVGGGEVAFEAMKVDQLKVELAERGSTRSGRKAILRPGSHNSD